MTSLPLVGRDEIEAAYARVAPYVHRTPTHTMHSVGGELGIDLHLKAELFQRSGSFKLRGVVNTLLTTDPADLTRGVVSMSAGNHAAALALGARLVSTRAHVVMPAYASRAKVAATEAYGGRVVLTERPLAEVMAEVRDELGATVIHPFDDPRVIAGAAGVGVEILADVPDADLVLVAVGGGGLISGVAAAVAAAGSHAKVVGVEPESADAMSRALAAGEPVPLDRPVSIADGCTAPFAGRYPLAHVSRLVDHVVRITDDDIASGTLLLHERAKLYAEPAGGAALAALLTGAVTPAPGARVVCVVSGGNLDAATMRRLLDHAPG